MNKYQLSKRADRKTQAKARRKRDRQARGKEMGSDLEIRRAEAKKKGGHYESD